jgi:hypothetical protein
LTLKKEKSMCNIFFALAFSVVEFQAVGKSRCQGLPTATGLSATSVAKSSLTALATRPTTLQQQQKSYPQPKILGLNFLKCNYNFFAPFSFRHPAKKILKTFSVIN